MSTPTDAGRILRAWTRANEPRPDYDRVLVPPPPPDRQPAIDADPAAWDRAHRASNPDPDAGVVTLCRCPRCGGEHALCATCPACNLTGVPLCDDGQLAAHGWARGGVLSDGPLDEDGWPTPGEWSGCGNRSPNASR